MRRPHVYERSAPRTPRSAYHEPQGNALVAAREIALVLGSLLSKAELCGLPVLADALQRALDEADAPDRDRRGPEQKATSPNTAEMALGADMDGVMSRMDTASLQTASES